MSRRNRESVYPSDTISAICPSTAEKRIWLLVSQPSLLFLPTFNRLWNHFFSLGTWHTGGFSEWVLNWMIPESSMDVGYLLPGCIWWQEYRSATYSTVVAGGRVSACQLHMGTETPQSVINQVTPFHTIFNSILSWCTAYCNNDAHKATPCLWGHLLDKLRKYMVFVRMRFFIQRETELRKKLTPSISENSIFKDSA